MDISLDFARMLLEADQLARGQHHEDAQVVYRAMAGLAGLDAAELALAESRLARLGELLVVDDGLEVVERSAPEPAPSDGARAEDLANTGDLAGAVEIYTQIVHSDPDNSLAVERLTELRAQLAATETPVAPPAPPAELTAELSPEPETEPAGIEIDFEDAPAVAIVADTAAAAVRGAVAELAGGGDWQQDLPEDPVAMLELLLERLQTHRRARA